MFFVTCFISDRQMANVYFHVFWECKKPISSDVHEFKLFAHVKL